MFKKTKNDQYIKHIGYMHLVMYLFRGEWRLQMSSVTTLKSGDQRAALIVARDRLQKTIDAINVEIGES